MELKTAEFVFADCQSTGASPANGNILEIAWCKTSAFAEPVQINSHILQQPADRPIPFIVQSITGIGEKELVDASHPAEVYTSFSSLFSIDTPQANFAVIHYGRFEKAFLDHWHVTFSQSDEPAPYKILCTHEIAKRIFPNLPTRGINGLAGYFGATIHDTKRSASHVHATWLIWRGLVDELNKLGIGSVQELEEWLKVAKVAKRGKLEYPLEKTKRTSLPNKPGVYRMFDRAGNILYVGKATSLKSRVNSYFRGRAGKDARRLEMLTRAYDLKVTECDTPLEAAILETDEIKRLNPPYNVVLKTGRRQLVYYDRELREWSTERDMQHMVGPFSGPFMIEPIVRLSNSLETDEFDELIFFDFIEKDLLREAFKIFVDNWNLPESCKSPRQFMAFALRHYKKLLRLKALAMAQAQAQAQAQALALTAAAADKQGEKQNIDIGDGATSGDEALSLTIEDDDEIEDLSDIELTPEEIAEKFERMFLRAAKAYVQSKALCALANSFIAFSDCGKSKILQVSEGVITDVTGGGSSKRTAAIEASISKEFITDNSLIVNEPIGTYIFGGSEPQTVASSMDLTTFDRMRVLLSELGRVAATGSQVKIQYAGSLIAPSWILNRSLV
jgi:DNA polymerase III subunit epsilon